MSAATPGTTKQSKLDKQDQIIAAAMRVFGRYGYKRSSMALIAEAAGISRPALYQDFGGKQDIFRAMGVRLLDGVILAAELAGESDGTTADRLYGALSIKLEMVIGTVDAQFRAELLTEASQVAGDLVDEFRERFAGTVERLLLSAADELDLLDEVLPARDCALLLLNSVTGITQEAASLEEAQIRLRQLVDLTVRSLTSRPAPHRD
ncbi:TetR/AcrR family transcriptional regulator [Kitasatospora sp. NPDC051170]|uniref:TetR/AcrR family transcriptional regulator n=1 Tax=Kitasatospora sp. NPDC051170 TaxID=3364056 RepID=UPI0037A3FF5D